MNNLTHRRGDTFKKTITSTLNGTPINFTGGAVKFCIKKDYNKSEYLLAKTSMTISTTSASIVIADTITSLWSLGNYYYEIEYTNTSLEVLTLESGMIEITYDL